MKQATRKGLLPLLALGWIVSWAPSAAAQVSLLTYHNDNARDGVNANETLLTTSNVTQSKFGKLFAATVDGYVYAQPLYVPNVMIAGQGMHNVVFVATENDTVYAFDADSNGGSNSAPLWQTSLFIAGTNGTPIPSSDLGCGDLVPNIGITGTPVIDGNSGTLYVVAATKENGQYFQRLHALNITSGQEVMSPAVIEGSVAGTGEGSSGGTIAFDPFLENQRDGLVLVNGKVFIVWSSHCDIDPYHGWVMAYDAGTFNQVAVYNDTANGSRGGIWQGGGAPAVDSAGNLFFETGNGTFDANTGGVDFGDSVLKLALSGSTISVADYFTPYNQKNLSNADLDLGSGGTVLLPDQTGAHAHLEVAYGKQGVIYLLDRDNMGHFQSGSNSQIVQSFRGVTGMFSTAAFFNNVMYTVGSGDVLKAFPFSAGLFSTRPSARATTTIGFPGSTPSVSANGTSNGIVWILDNSAYASSGPAILHAYLASNVHTELYNSTQAANGRDTAGPAVKFTVPTVVNGKVYVGGQSQLTVYGLF